MPWLRLIRWRNLLIIFFTQLLAWWCVILPESPRVLNFINFLFLSLSTVLIAAAGYIINDYFDIKIDSINKPGKMVLEKMIPRKQAIISHSLLNIIALLLAGYVAAWAHHYEWLFIQVACTLLLWFYSTDFKRQYMTGNIVIALLTALTIITLLIYEPAMRRSHDTRWLFSGTILSKPEWVLVVYAYFAFMLTWMREIVKDMEDHEGDGQEGCITMPVKRGLQYASRFTIALSMLVILPLGLAACLLFTHHEIALPLYIIALLIIPLVAWTSVLGKNSSTQHYHTASNRLKVIMLLGVCSLIIYHFQLLISRA